MSDELNETTPVSLKIQYFTIMVFFQIGSDIQRRAQKFENCPFSRLLFSETAGNSLTRVNTFQGVTDLSSMISQSIHDQVCFYDWRRNISPGKCTACQKFDISRHFTHFKRQKWHSEISGKLVQMLGICDSEHDSFDASRRSIKVEANSRARQSRNLRVD